LNNSDLDLIMKNGSARYTRAKRLALAWTSLRSASHEAGRVLRCPEFIEKLDPYTVHCLRKLREVGESASFNKLKSGYSKKELETK
jgi:hypothetical protein